MISVRRRLSPSASAIVVLCAGYLIAPLQAFSNGEFSSRRVTGWPRTSSRTHAFFYDEDCEDLCGDSSIPSPSDIEDEKATKERVKSTISHISPIRQRKGPRALWWAGESCDKCKTCAGSGEQTCRFCGGIDFLSAIGGETDALSCEGIGKDCPVCDDGLEDCQGCAGTGIIFSRSRDKSRTGSLHP